MEACPKTKYELVVRKKEKHNFFYIIFPKDQKLKRKFNFDIPKFQFPNGVEQKTSQFWAFFRPTGLWELNPQKVQILNSE